MLSNHFIVCCCFLLLPSIFPTSWFFASSGQSIGDSTSSLVLSVNIQGWLSLGLTGLISLLSKGPSRGFSNSTIWKHQFFSPSQEYYHFNFLGGSDGNESVCNAGDLGSIPGLGRSPGEGKGYPLQHSCLKNPMDGANWRATAYGVAKSQTRLSDFHFITLSLIFWRWNIMPLKLKSFPQKKAGFICLEW